MNNFIYEPNPSKLNQDSNNVYYCLAGLGDHQDSEGYDVCNDDNDKRVLAKKLFRVNGTIKYLIKTAEDKKLYNPLSIYDNKDNKKFLETISRNQNSFKEVNYTSFHLYLRFLKTKNVAYLNNAEREI
jgi:hypothetical protein